MNKLKRIYNLTDIRYPWLLLLSMVMFILSLCFHRLHPNIDSNMEIVIYGAGFAVALTWSILNYISHLKLNTIYKKHDDIAVFVEHMSMKKDEKIELIQYLNDFVKDLEEKGDTHENAVKKAISHFQVQEFTAAQDDDLFEKPTHYYLLGYVSIFVGVILIIRCLDIIFPVPFMLLAASFMLVLYSIAFFCLFFLYKLLDVLISKK